MARPLRPRMRRERHAQEIKWSVRPLPPRHGAGQARCGRHRPSARGCRRPTPPPTPDRTAPTATSRPGNWFQRLKAGLSKSSSRLSEDITGIFTKRKLDADTLEELEDHADPGGSWASRPQCASPRPSRKGRFNKEISPEEVRAVLAAEVERTLAPVAKPLRSRATPAARHPGRGRQRHRQDHHHRQARRTASPARATTSRWRPATPSGPRPSISSRSGASARAPRSSRVTSGADAAGLAFDALSRRAKKGSDVLLIDTAGRLQNKQALMDELEKMIRVLRKIRSERAASGTAGARCNHGAKCA